VNTRDPELLASLALYWSRLGDAGKALPRAAEARALGPADRTVQWRATLAYELCGHRREALDTLASALRLGQPWNEIRNEPALAALREDAGYKRLPGRREDAR
jgi:hypothetical protein